MPTTRQGRAAKENGVAAPWCPRGRAGVRPAGTRPEDQRDEADGGGVGRVVADLLEPARAGDDATSAVDDLARRRIDEIAGGLERLGPAGAEEPPEGVQRELEQVLGELEHREPQRDEPGAEEERPALARADQVRAEPHGRGHDEDAFGVVRREAVLVEGEEEHERRHAEGGRDGAGRGHGPRRTAASTK